MVKKIIRLLIMLFIIIAIPVIYLQHSYVLELKKQMLDRDSIIAKYEANDSIYANRLKQYVDTVEKYISPQFKLGNKNISVNELLKLTNKSMRRADFLEYQLNSVRDSVTCLLMSISEDNKKINQILNTYQDSAFIYRNYVELIKPYGFKFYHEKNGLHYKFSFKAERVDSALMLLPFFRDRLTYNAKEKHWFVVTKKELFHSRRK